MVFALIPIGVVGLGLMDMPYGYYTLVRLVVCLSGLGFAAFLYDKGNSTWMLMALLGLLYNPLIPIHLTREIWFPINLITIASFAYMLPVLKRHLKEEKEEVTKLRAASEEKLKQKFELRESLKKPGNLTTKDSSAFDPEREDYFQKALRKYNIETSPKSGKLLKRKKSEINAHFLVSIAETYKYRFDRKAGRNATDWSVYYSDELFDWIALHFDKDILKEMENAANIVQDMWEYLIQKYGDTHPGGEHHEYAQNYRLEKVNLSGMLHYRAILEQARRLGINGAVTFIPPGFRSRLEEPHDLPTPSWEK